MPEGAEEGILRGMLPARAAAAKDAQRPAARLGHDPARGAGRAPSCSREDFGVAADVWSVTELHRAAPRRHGGRALEPPAPGRGAEHDLRRRSASAAATRPVVAATDYMRAFADQIRPWVAGRYTRARHRRLRPQRLPRGAARVLRGRPPPRRAGRAERAGRRRRRRRRAAEKAIEQVRDRRGARRPHGGGDRGPVPDIGDFEDVPVIEILVAAGDTVAEEDPLVTLESDKATMEVPAPFAGTVAELEVKVGDTVSEGRRASARGRGSGDGAAPRPRRRRPRSARRRRRREAARPPAASEERRAGSARRGRGRVRRRAAAPATAAPRLRQPVGAPAGPRARHRPRPSRARAARGGSPRRTSSGARARSRPRRPAAGGDRRPRPRAVAEGRLREVRRGRARPLIADPADAGPNLARNWVTIPHVTHHEDADITDLEAFRKELNAEQSTSR